MKCVSGYLAVLALFFSFSSIGFAGEPTAVCNELLSDTIRETKDVATDIQVGGYSKIYSAFDQKVGELAGAIAKEIFFTQKVIELQNRAEVAIAGKHTLNGFRVRYLNFNKDGSIANDEKIPGDTKLWSSHYFFSPPGHGEVRGYALEKEGRVWLLFSQAGVVGVNAEVVLLVKGGGGNPRKWRQEVFGIETTKHGYIERMAQNIEAGRVELEVPQTGYGTDSTSARDLLREFELIERLPRTNEKVEELFDFWSDAENKIAELAINIDLRSLIEGIAAAHKKQLAIIDDGRRKVSHFVFDERGSIRVGKSFKLPNGQTVYSYRKSQLLKISGASGRLEFVMDIPDPEDTSVRLWVSGGDMDVQERYMLPLVGNSRAIILSSATHLKSIYSALLFLKHEMDEANDRLTEMKQRQ